MCRIHICRTDEGTPRFPSSPGGLRPDRDRAKVASDSAGSFVVGCCAMGGERDTMTPRRSYVDARRRRDLPWSPQGPFLPGLHRSVGTVLLLWNDGGGRPLHGESVAPARTRRAHRRAFCFGVDRALRRAMLKRLRLRRQNHPYRARSAHSTRKPKNAAGDAPALQANGQRLTSNLQRPTSNV